MAFLQIVVHLVLPALDYTTLDCHSLYVDQHSAKIRLQDAYLGSDVLFQRTEIGGYLWYILFLKTNYCTVYININLNILVLFVLEN